MEKVMGLGPLEQKPLTEADSGIGGSLPAIGNVDDDCYPEIVISYINFVVIYKFDGTTHWKKYFNIQKKIILAVLVYQCLILIRMVSMK